MQEMRCPKCGSTNTYRSKKFNAWICEDCDEKFSVPINVKWNSGLQSSEFWCTEFCQYAPCSLSHSYGQLMHYVAEGNIGCTLFLIRDVFELMIKIPAVILFDSIYSLLENIDDFKPQFDKEPKLEALYRNSMQMLSTGKWWECVRLGAGLSMDSISLNGLDEHRSAVLSDTISYLKQVYKLFEFRVPGKQKVNMVTWRNRAVGHSCLASKPEESYPEIPYILKMFKKISEISLLYYRKVCFANGNKDLLTGVNSGVSVEQVFIAYKINEGCHYFRIHDFVAGRKDSMSYFDGYEKGKAYLLDYGDGERYKAAELSKFIMSAKNELDNSVAAANAASSADINENNLETADIQQLEAQLSEENQVVHVDYLYQWLERQVKIKTSGVFLLQAERGMGKSTFCRTINQLSQSENVLWYSDELDGWSEFMENAAVRVWHFNSTYYGRKDIYLKGIKDALLTLEPGNLESGMWSEPNRLVGNLDSIWGKLNECSEDLRKLYFVEALNMTAAEYFRRTNKNKLILVLDGVDEILDYNELMSYIPSSDTLNSNVYILITCRTNEEIAAELKTIFISDLFSAKLIFKRNEIIESGQTESVLHTNETYLQAVRCYVDRSIRSLNCEMVADGTTIMEHFDNRFSELTAYFSLCQLNPRFCMLSDTELLQSFLLEIKNNSTSAYYSKVLLILNTLVWCGDSLTLRELAFLSGEGYVSYRFLGILNDLRAFIKVIRTERGNCYELSHSEWEESVKKQFPLGGIEFRMCCDELLDCLDDLRYENRTGDILLDAYEGERWLFTHMLSIYVRDWAELKENWFEHLSLEKLEAFAERTILDFAEDKKEKLVCKIDFRDFYQNYSMVLNLYDQNRINSKMEILFQTNRLLLMIADLYHRLAFEYAICDSKNRRKYMECAGYLWHSLSSLAGSESDAALFKEKMIETNNELYRIMSESIDLEERGLALYKRGRVYQIQSDYSGALELFKMLIGEIDGNLESVSVNLRRYYCRAYIRVAQILMKLNCNDVAIQHYLHMADKETDALLQVVETIDTLSTKAFCEEIFANYYKRLNNHNKEIEHLYSAISLCDKMLERKNNKSYLNSKYIFYERLYKIFFTKGEYIKALDVIEQISCLDRVLYRKNQISTLQKKCEAYQILNMDTLEIKQTLEEEERLKDEQALAYSQVYRWLELCEAESSSMISKIPQGFRDYLEKHRKSDMTVDIDPKIPIKEQIGERGLALIALIVTNYWYEEYPGHSEIYQKNEEKFRLQRWNQLKKRMQCHDLVQRAIGDNKHVSYNEVFWLFEHLPKEIISLLPIDVIIWVKDHRIIDYHCDLQYTEILDLCDDTIALMKYLLESSNIQWSV